MRGVTAGGPPTITRWDCSESVVDIEEAERFLPPERAVEGVEQRKLVLALMRPGRLDLIALVSRHTCYVVFVLVTFS